MNAWLMILACFSILCAADAGSAALIPAPKSAQTESELMTQISSATDPSFTPVSDLRTILYEMQAIHRQMILLGSIAQTNSQSKKIRNYAQQLILDHSFLRHLLNDLASKVHREIPEEPGEFADSQLAKEFKNGQHLANKGFGFDKSWLAAVVKNEAASVNWLENMKAYVKNDQVYYHIKDIAPILTQQKDLAALLLREQKDKL